LVSISRRYFCEFFLLDEQLVKYSENHQMQTMQYDGLIKVVVEDDQVLKLLQLWHDNIFDSKNI
jgi:hypothetical protein